MSNYNDLYIETANLHDEELRDYLEDFFSPAGYSEYEPSNAIDEKETCLLYSLFNGEGELLERADKVLEDDPLCLEAFLIAYLLEDEVFVNRRFMNVKMAADPYDELSPYKKECFALIINYYVRFCIDIHNLTFALKAVKLHMAKEPKYVKDNIITLSYLYCLLENKDDFYELYLNNEFSDPGCYLLLMVVLLKHEDELKAQEVYAELLSKFKYAAYIDHIWDLEQFENDEAFDFRNAIDVFFEEICSIPYFFSWCADHKMTILKS